MASKPDNSVDTDRVLPGMSAPKPPSFSKLKSVLKLHVGWEGGFIRKMPGYHRVDLHPTDEYPTGRKGLAISKMWELMAEEHTSGVIILDGDVAIDPHDNAAMDDATKRYPDHVNIGASIIWPISTNFSTWVWAHRRNGAKKITDWQVFTDSPDTFSFCFTYLPRRLLEACMPIGMSSWTYPQVDYNVTKAAQRLEIPMRVVENCNPKHMNY
jgi:hypothetical protein